MLRFLIASRDEVSSRQLRDDLLSMLVAGHETTGSVLTWTLYLLEQNPSTMAKVNAYLAWRHMHIQPACNTESEGHSCMAKSDTAKRDTMAEVLY